MSNGKIKAKLIDLAEYINGYAFNEGHWGDTGLPIVRIAQLTGTQPITDFYSGQIDSNHLIQHDEIIFCWSGTLLVTKWKGQAAWLNQHLFKVIPKRNIDRDFFYHLLKYSVAEIEKSAHGSAMVHITRAELSKFEVFFPEHVETQRQIAKRLDIFDSTLSCSRLLINKLQMKKQGLLNDLLSRGVDSQGNLRPSYEDAPDLYEETELGFIPKEWNISLLDDVTTRGSGHTPNKNISSYWNGGIKWVSLADSSKLDQIHIFETDKEISTLGIQNSSAVMHSKGTVILSRDAGIGKSAILTENMAVSQHFMAWKCSKQLNNYFLYYWLQKDKPVFENIAIGSTIKTIGLPFFKTYKIAVPSISEQEKVSAILLDTDKYLSDEVNKLNKLEKVKIGLLKDLLQN